MKNKPPSFRPGTTITNDATFLTIEAVVKHSYRFTNGEYMPYSLVDRYWRTATDTDTEIED